MKILHLTYHQGLKSVLDFVIKSLNQEDEHIAFETQIAYWNYNIGHQRAEEIWNKYKDYYNQFDLIITSDTTPLSRIFLQNNYRGKLIIYVCNRFDYVDQATNDCSFPDHEYYHLINQAKNKSNVKIFSYTKFEHEYARRYRGIELGVKVIKPFVDVERNIELVSGFPENINKSETFFIPPYHNDTLFINLKEKCQDLGINCYAGRYNGPSDLNGIKGIIHIPYAWSNLALFENWSLGNVYFIPSKKFFLTLSKQKNFWWQDSYALNLLDISEWYCAKHKDLFIYFDSWEHLKSLTEDFNLIKSKKEMILPFSRTQCSEALFQWSQAIYD